MRFSDYLSWSDSSYKRLWQNGFRGRFGLANQFFVKSNKPIMTNFGLPLDEALASWSANNIYFKPQDGWNYFQNLHQIIRVFPDFQVVYSQPEAMGYVTKSRTRALGAMLSTAGAIDGGFIDMSQQENDEGTKYNFGKTHSAQWRWNIQSTAPFWSDLVETLALRKVAQ